MARILVVDDSEKIRKFVETILLEKNHDVLLAGDAYAAMDLLDKYRFDLLILDVNLPFKDGFTTLKTMRENPKFKFLPVIFMTVRNSKRDIERAASLDADAYVLKPIIPESFGAKVAEVLSRGRQLQPDVTFSDANELGRSSLTLTVETRIMKISEIGIDIFSDHLFSEGQKLRIQSPLFSHIGIEIPLLKVSSVRSEGHGYLLKMAFVDLSQDSLEILRSWLYSERPLENAS